jgi:hypothetical protein
MAKAKYINSGRMADNIDMNIQQNMDINESVNELIDPDLLLRSFGISDDFVDHMADLYSQPDGQAQGGVILKNSQMAAASNNSAFSTVVSQGSQNVFQLASLQSIISPQQVQPLPQAALLHNLFSSSTSSSSGGSGNPVPVTLQQRAGESEVGSPADCHVTLPLETLQNLLSQQNIGFCPTDLGGVSLSAINKNNMLTSNFAGIHQYGPVPGGGEPGWHPEAIS